MLGNEAIARGAYEAGVKVSSAYPGTPSTEISEYLVQYRDDVYEEWAPNEKVATEVAVGASIAGVRSMACMKHVGLNVAADPLYSVSYMGVNGGLVLVVADDPGLYSSQNEQDTRMVARAAQIPVIEPSDSAEAKDFFKAAFELSEKFDRPFIFRTTTRLAHSQGLVELCERENVEDKEYVKNVQKNVMMPGNAKQRHIEIERLNKERDLVGIYLSAHPLDEFAIVLDHVCNTRMADLEDKAALAGREITMGGIVTSVRRGVSKNGNPYGIAKIEDYSGSTEIPFWGNDWVTYQGYLNEGTFLYIKARCQAKQWRQDELEVKITSMELLPDVKEELVQKITIIIPLSVLNSGLITELATLTKEHPGNTELYFKVTDDTDSRMSVDLISRPVKLSVGRDLITYLKERPELGFRIN